MDNNNKQQISNQFGFQSNQNYKILVRIKPVLEEEGKMIQLVDEGSILVKDLTSTINKDGHIFNFNNIFDETTSQLDIFNKIKDTCLNKFIEGFSSTVICYGQTGSGKSYTLFGRDVLQEQPVSISQKNGKLGSDAHAGLVQRTMDFIYDRGEKLKQIREFEISCNMYEIFLDNIRDLSQSINGGSLSVKNFEKENLEVLENSNNQVLIKNLQTVTIKKKQDVLNLIKKSFELINKIDNPKLQLNNRSHIIFNINLNQKDKENDNITIMNSTIQFVDLAGSERIAKSLIEGHKLQEQIYIGNSLSTLQKCLQCIAQSTQKQVPYKESKLTRCLQNYLNVQYASVLIACVNPQKQNYEEVLGTLQYADRTKNVPRQKVNQSKPLEAEKIKNNNNNNQIKYQQNAMSSLYTEEDIKKYQEEEADALKKLKNLEQNHKRKLKQIQEMLGLDVDIERVLHITKGSKDIEKDVSKFKAQKEAMFQLEQVQLQLKDAERRYHILLKQKEELERENYAQQEQLVASYFSQKEQIIKLQDKNNFKSNEFSQNKAFVKIQQDHDLKNFDTKFGVLSSEKDRYIYNLPDQQNVDIGENETTMNNLELQRLVSAGHSRRKQSLYKKRDFSKELQNYRQEYMENEKKVKEQYNYYFQSRADNLQKLESDLNQYHKKSCIKQQKILQEMFQLHADIEAFHNILQKLILGKYHSLRKGVALPKQELPQHPNRNTHPQLFKYLDKQELHKMRSNTLGKKLKIRLSQFQDFKGALQLEKLDGDAHSPKSMSNSQASNDNFMKFSTQKNNNARVSNTALENEEKFDENSPKRKPFDLEKLNPEQKIETLNQQQLKYFLSDMKKALEIYQEQEISHQLLIKQFQKENKDFDILSLKKEIIKFKKLIEEELLRKNQIKATTESQKRLIQQNNIQKNNTSELIKELKKSNGNVPGYIRPQTSSAVLSKPISQNQFQTFKNNFV